MADLALIESKETAKAAQAFADYVAMGPTRSLEKLVRLYRSQNAGNSPTHRLGTLQLWSSEHGWQDRLKAMAAEQLGQAVELKTTTYINILGEYHRRVDNEPMRKSMQLQALHGIFDRVKPDTPSDSGSSGTNVTIQFAFIETMRTN